MTMDNGVMKMRPVEGGLGIKPGETVTLKPSGSHVMLMDLKHGDTMKQPCGSIKPEPSKVMFPVAAIGATTCRRRSCMRSPRSINRLQIPRRRSRLAARRPPGERPPKFGFDRQLGHDLLPTPGGICFAATTKRHGEGRRGTLKPRSADPDRARDHFPDRHPRDC
jgi:Copper chaperone PCu(A)C